MSGGGFCPRSFQSDADRRVILPSMADTDLTSGVKSLVQLANGFWSCAVFADGGRHLRSDFETADDALDWANLWLDCDRVVTPEPIW